MVSVRKNDFIETGIRPNNAINTDKTTAKGRRGFAGYLVRTFCYVHVTLQSQKECDMHLIYSIFSKLR